MRIALAKRPLTWLLMAMTAATIVGLNARRVWIETNYVSMSGMSYEACRGWPCVCERSIEFSYSPTGAPWHGNLCRLRTFPARFGGARLAVAVNVVIAMAVILSVRVWAERLPRQFSLRALLLTFTLFAVAIFAAPQSSFFFRGAGTDACAMFAALASFAAAGSRGRARPRGANDVAI